MPSQKQQRLTNEYPCNTREDFLLFEYSALTENDKANSIVICKLFSCGKQ
jgi:hypothetical protein